jgi:DNA mismatch repair protein MutL
MVIDQRRAHMRVLYEQYTRRRGGRSLPSQQILFPAEFMVESASRELFTILVPELKRFGFGLNEKHPGTWEIHAIPSGLERIRPEELLTRIIAGSSDLEEFNPEEIQDKMAFELAEAGAISYGIPLGSEEMKHIVDELFACSAPNYLPNGKPVVKIIPFDEITGYFQ